MVKSYCIFDYYMIYLVIEFFIGCYGIIKECY